MNQIQTFSALLAFCEGKTTGHRWIPSTKASDAGLWCFHLTAPEQTVGQTIKTLVSCLRHYRAHYDVVVMGLKIHLRDGNWDILGSDNGSTHTRQQVSIYTYGDLSIVKWANFELNQCPQTNMVLTHQTMISSIVHWTKTSYSWEKSYWITFL